MDVPANVVVVAHVDDGVGGGGGRQDEGAEGFARDEGEGGHFFFGRCGNWRRLGAVGGGFIWRWVGGAKAIAAALRHLNSVGGRDMGVRKGHLWFFDEGGFHDEAW